MRRLLHIRRMVYGMLIGAVLLLSGGALADGPIPSDVIRGTFGALTFVDDTAFLQGELDRLAHEGGGVLDLGARVYTISKPLVVHPSQLSGHCGLTIRGQGVYRTPIIKTRASTSGLPKRAYRGAIDLMDVDALLVVDHPDGAMAQRLVIENLSLHSMGDGMVEYGVYAPRLAYAILRNVAIEFVRVGVFGHQWSLCDLDQVWLSGAGRQRGTALLLQANGGASQMVNLRGVAAQRFQVGYYAQGLSASAWDGCMVSYLGTPDAAGAAYYLEDAQGVVLSGCGAANMMGATLRVIGGALAVRGFSARDLQGANGETGTLELAGVRADFAACTWAPLTEPRGQKDIVYGMSKGPQGPQATRAAYSVCQLPSGGTGIAGAESTD